MVGGVLRQRRVEEALARGEYAPLDESVAFALAAVGVLLGVATVLVLVLGS